MKIVRPVFRHVVCVLAIVLGFGASIFAQAEDADKTLSPYFKVWSKDDTPAQMPLKHTEADVNIAGIIADVRIRQIYQNNGQNTLDATYVFPASTRAAVYAMTMKVGTREIHAKIKEREEAREMFETAKAKGQTASLLEQQRPNVFQMSLTNILPGDSVVVELHFTETIVPTEGVYEFVYPTVVMPRYTGENSVSDSMATAAGGNPPARDREAFTNMPYTTAGEAPTYTFGFRMNILGGVTVREINSPSHEFESKMDEAGSTAIQLKDMATAGNRD
ncbi:MAG: VIT domain-containing protein, partial [Bacteroidota bacterium]